MVIELAKKRKRSAVDDVLDLTRGSVGSTVGVSAIYSLPSTPSVPSVEVAKGFAGQSMGLMNTVRGAGGLLRSVEGLEKAGKKRRK